MTKYTVKIPHSVIYSIGDTHARGREVIEMISKLEMRSVLRGEERPAFVQLGDLCDGFAMPKDWTVESLRGMTMSRINEIPELREVIYRENNHFVNWHRDLGVRELMTGSELLACDEPEVATAVYQATKCFETLLLYSRYQQAHPNQFYVIFGNHDGDLLRGQCAYGRQQKYILLGLLGLSPDAVISHMTKGWTRRVLRNPWLNWLNHRPHIIMSRDTVYMHGGPTGSLSQQLAETGCEGFEKWCEDMDKARGRGMLDPAFEEHKSFLSPDGADNDWLNHPDCIRHFIRAAGTRFLAVGHSPFLDYEKGPLLDLANATDEMKMRFRTPAQLEPDGLLIKHDTDMKRMGGFWACRHEVGSDEWTGIDGALNESSLRR